MSHMSRSQVTQDGRLKVSSGFEAYGRMRDGREVSAFVVINEGHNGGLLFDREYNVFSFVLTSMSRWRRFSETLAGVGPRMPPRGRV